MQNNYICYNGDFHRGNDPGLHVLNRVFRFNDALTENIHAYATSARFLDLHLKRLITQMEIFGMEVPLFLNAQNIGKLITDLLNKNRIFGGAHIRFTVFRNEGEEVIPSSNSISFLLESTVLNNGRYTLNEKGLTVDISRNYKRQAGFMSAFYRPNVNLFMLASREAQQAGVDRMILLNESGRLTEANDSNIFLVSGNSLFTPALEMGCIDGIMRKVIIDYASREGYRVNEQSSLTTAALYDADEVFLTNAINGIMWVVAFRQKRFFNKTARRLSNVLNEEVFE